MQEEFLLENSWIYQQYIEKGIGQGFERGIGQGLERGIGLGQAQAMQENIQMMIEMRFPSLLRLARQRLMAMNDLAKLQELFTATFEASSPEAVEQSLRALS